MRGVTAVPELQICRFLWLDVVRTAPPGTAEFMGWFTQDCVRFADFILSYSRLSLTGEYAGAAANPVPY